MINQLAVSQCSSELLLLTGRAALSLPPAVVWCTDQTKFWPRVIFADYLAADVDATCKLRMLKAGLGDFKDCGCRW